MVKRSAMAVLEKNEKTASDGAGNGERAAAAAPPNAERFDEILNRLRSVVEKLEGGNLSLEDSLKFFEEGIGLCRRGATILDSAERKVEVLLGVASGPGGAAVARTAAFEAPQDDGD